jgi:two-component system response regulator YesN
MNKTWFNRLLFSYVPIFFFIISFLFFVFFQVLNERTQQDTLRANEALNTQAIQLIDYSLKAIDYLMVSEFSKRSEKSDMVRFFEQEGQPAAYFTYQIIESIQKMKQSNPLIHNMYLVRMKDGAVLSEHTVSTIANFADQSFIKQLMTDQFTYHWTVRREFKEFAAGKGEDVVSLVRKYTAYSGDVGLMVVSVKISSLHQLISQMYDSTNSFIDIKDQSGHFLFENANLKEKHPKVLTQIHSEYTNWLFQSGLINGTIFSVVSTFSHVWVILSLIVVVLGLASIVYVTQRNYKPLKSIIAQLNNQSFVKASSRNNNEFTYIESSIDEMMEQYKVFKNQSLEDSSYRRKTVFFEILEGKHAQSWEDWKKEASRYGVQVEYQQTAVVVLSIDKFAALSELYTEHDLALYKFIIQNAYSEILQQYHLANWSEWTNNKQMHSLIYATEKNHDLMNTILQVTENLLTWIRYNLPFTVTIGLGKPIESIDLIKESYKSALETMNYKGILGSDRSIGFWEMDKLPTVELYNHLQRARSFVYSFRYLETDWRAKLAHVFQEIRADQLGQADITNLLSYLSYHLFQNIKAVITEEPLLQSNQKIMNDLIENFETLEDTQDEFLFILEKFEFLMLDVFEKSNHHNLAKEIKRYIEEHISNPDLSLSHLSEHFGINSKNLSHLFKDEFDVKFIDFIIHRRVELAKHFLISTTDNIQEIAEKVGYISPISFNRVFKRVVGIPPGDYRKENIELTKP